MAATGMLIFLICMIDQIRIILLHKKKQQIKVSVCDCWFPEQSTSDLKSLSSPDILFYLIPPDMVYKPNRKSSTFNVSSDTFYVLLHTLAFTCVLHV